MKQNINTIKILSAERAVQREDILDIPTVIITVDIPLMRQVVNDMEYNVGNRPTIPSCFEESTELGIVDQMADIRFSNWDRLASECSFVRYHASEEKKSDSDTTNVDTSSTTQTE